MNNYTIVIDAQNDFVTGSLGNTMAQEAIKNIIDYINSLPEDEQLIFTRDSHFEYSYHKTLEGKLLPVKHCMHRTWGWEIVDELKDIAAIKATIIDKQSFGTLNWQSHIINPDRITIMGIDSSICVVSNALILRAMFPNTEIVVIEKCCASHSQTTHDAAMTVMKDCQIQIA